MDAFEDACNLLPPRLADALRLYPAAEELRLRISRRPAVVTGGRELFFSDTVLTDALLSSVLERATGASIHTCAASIGKGYFCSGMLRIGVCGEAIIESGALRGFRHYSSVAVRIPHAQEGLCTAMIDGILADGAKSTLIAAPPGAGKTTLLRELIRISSDSGKRVSVIDERNEIAAYDGDGFGFAVGRCSDILTGVCKREGAIMLLRSMNPEIIAMDEISDENDVATVAGIAGCGVSLFATAHGSSIKDMLCRSVYRRLFEADIFRNIITVTIADGKRKYSLEKI